MAANVTEDNSGRATVREVYQLVGEVRTEVVDRIDELADEVRKVVTAQEHRLTILETVSLQHTGALADHTARLAELEIAHQRAVGHLGAWKAVIGATLVGCGGLIADLVMRMVR